MLKWILLLSCSAICFVQGQILHKYEVEFLDPRVFKPCENYPDNFIDKLVDTSKIEIEQTDDGSIIAKGSAIFSRDVDPPLPAMIESYKKERGTWQPTIFTQKRSDLCTSFIDANEAWHAYLKNTPKEQLKCPFRDGAIIDFDVNEPTVFTSPTRSTEGEYNFRIEVGDKNGDFFICADVFAMVHKV